jgi:predicted nuclease of predicted toxin-antitoxin system
VKLLFDQNLAPRLVSAVADLFPASAHVRDLGLASATDIQIWEFAKAGGFVIVSKDADFRQLSFVYGGPPKVIWLRLGNVTTSAIALALRSHAAQIAAFDADAVAAMFVVGA